MKEQFKKDDFLAKWLNSDLSEEELKSFESDEDFETFKAIAEMSKELKPPQVQKEKVWSEIENKTNVSARILPLRRSIAYAVAAIVLALFGFIFLFQNQVTTFSTPIASTETFTLPDGSEVVLNALSKITFDKKKFNEIRSLQLEGEAFFKVQKGSSFLVETTNGNVQVLGTSFNVFSRKDKLDVTCYTGLVGVYFEDESAMEELAPNDKIIAKNGQIISKMTINDQSSPEWSDGNSRFYMANMTEVIDELERQFDIKVTYPPELRDIKDYNGGFPHDDLESALQIIFSSFDYQFEINGKEIRVFK